MPALRSMFALSTSFLALILLPVGVVGQPARVVGVVQDVVGEWRYRPASGGEPSELVAGAFVEVGSIVDLVSESGEVRLLMRDRSIEPITCANQPACEGGRRIEDVEGSGLLARLLDAVGALTRDHLAGAPSETRSVGTTLVDGVLEIGDRGVSGLDEIMSAMPRGRYHLRLASLDGTSDPDYLGTCREVLRWPGITPGVTTALASGITSGLTPATDWPRGPATLSVAVADGTGCPGEGWRESAIVLVVPPNDPATRAFEEVRRTLADVEDEGARRRLLRAHLLTSGGDG